MCCGGGGLKCVATSRRSELVVRSFNWREGRVVGTFRPCKAVPGMHTQRHNQIAQHTRATNTLSHSHMTHEHTAPQLYSLTRLSLSLRLEDASPRAAERSRLSSALVRPRKASEDLGRSQKASMASSSSRKAPSVKAGLRALSYSNLESVSCSVLMPAVSSFLPG